MLACNACCWFWLTLLPPVPDELVLDRDATDTLLFRADEEEGGRGAGMAKWGLSGCATPVAVALLAEDDDVEISREGAAAAASLITGRTPLAGSEAEVGSSSGADVC